MKPPTPQFTPPLARPLLGALLLTLAAHPATLMAGAQPMASTWSELISRHVDAEQVVWLETPAGKTLALYQADRSGRPQGAAILIHEASTHADWPAVIHPLREGLPDHGWSTLSLQIAPESSESTAQEASPGIAAAVAFLNERGVTNIVLLGYGRGALRAQDYLLNGGQGVNALVSISPHGAGPGGDKAALLPPGTALLDIHAERDLPVVQRTISRRALYARRNGLQAAAGPRALPARAATAPEASGSYRLLLVTGADHGYRGYEAALIKDLLGWLRHHAPGIAITRPS